MIDKLGKLLRDIQDPNSQYNRRLRFEKNLKRNQKAFDNYKKSQSSSENVDESEEVSEEILKPSERILLRKNREFGGKFASTEWYRGAVVSELEQIQGNYDTTDLGDSFGFEIGKFYSFNYDALYPDRYPFWDQFPLSKILTMDVDNEKGTIYFLGANIHYLTPDGGYRGKVAINMLNSMNYVPDVCLHTYVLSGISNPLRVPDDDVDGLSNFITESFVDNNGKRVSPNKVWRT
jgi:hypothetical protein